jgi:uncharacterized protein (TIGR00369 family)
MSAVSERSRKPIARVDAARAVFESAVESHSQELGEFFLAKLLGFEVSYPGDACVVEFHAHDYLLNPRGTLHGGVLATAMDVAMTHLVQHVQGPATTVDLQVQYHGAVKAGPLRCEARSVHRGGSLWFMEARVTSAEGRRVASGTSTVMLATTGGTR